MWLLKWIILSKHVILVNNDITSEGIRVDEFTGKRFSLLQIRWFTMEVR
jgi:hypothetical protein